jgi:hypothetical protein
MWTRRIMPDAPCRLTVFLAREAPIGVVLRRGPSAWARLSLWHTDSDRFEHGQWLKCRVYERRADIAPDGFLFAYFARGVPRATGVEPGADSWIAVSRPPYVTALALWFVGGTYHTGPFFPDGRSLWTGFGAELPDQGSLPSWLKLQAGLLPYIDRTADWTERTVFINRLLRDGWARTDQGGPETWEHHNPHGAGTLIMTERADADLHSFGGRHLLEYAVYTRAGSDLTVLGTATWAGWDHHGRLSLAREGRLLHRRPDGTLEQLADFNGQVPGPQPAPAWARDWPPASSRTG